MKPAGTLKRLRGILAPEDILSTEAECGLYAGDSQKIYRVSPECVLFPRSGEQVAALVRLARESGIPVTARGAGTGLSGGAVPLEGGWLLNFARMRKLLSLDPQSRTAWVQPGLVNGELQELARPHGLHFAPDPSSQTVATLGGNFAENAGGPHCLKVGVMTQHVRRIEIVDERGNLHHLGSGGLGGEPVDAVGLLAGSEGTLALVTALELRLSPLPEAVVTLLAPFADLEAASGAVAAILARGLLPSALEMMDSECIRSVEASPYRAGYPEDAQAVLLVELDGFAEDVAAAREEVSQLLGEAGAIGLREAEDEAERERLWRGRKGAFGAAGRLYRDITVQDVTVPVSRLAEAVRRVNEAVREEGLEVASVYHAGDGNLHPKIGFDRTDPDQVLRLHKACERIMRIAVDLGGTLSGEHGIGIEKSAYLSMLLDAADREPMLRLKRGLDPDILFNPGKIFPPGDFLAGPQSALRLVSPTAPREGDASGFQRPGDLESLAALLAEGRPGLIFPTGARFPEELAPMPGPVGQIVSTASLTGVLDFHPGDFQVEVAAGTAWTELCGFLADRDQELGWQVPHPEQRSIGGVVATDEAWPFRGETSSPRDRLLGLEGLLSDGSVFLAGGRSVKNVAGYDLPRLLAGSRGALALITRLRLRTRPRAERRGLLILDFAEREQALGAGRLLAARFDFPGGVLMLPSSFELPGLESTVRVVLELAGGAGAFQLGRARILDTLSRERLRPREVLEEEGEGPLLAAIRDFPRDPGAGRVGTLREMRGPLPKLLGVLPYLGSRWILDLSAARLRVEETGKEPAETDPVDGIQERRAEIGRRGVEAPSRYLRLPGRVYLERIARSLDPSGRLAPGRWLFG